MKSRGLFPPPRSIPKRSFRNAAGNSEYKHVLPNSDDYQIGSLGWRAGRSAGGISGKNRLVNKPVWNHTAQLGEGGLAFDASAEPYMTDKGKPDKGYPDANAPIPIKISR